MFKNKFSILLIVVLSFFGGALLVGFSPNIQTFAQKIIRSRTDFGNQWQYCVITRINVENPPPQQLDKFIGNVQITYFSFSKDGISQKESYTRNECISYELNYGEFLQETGLRNSPQSQQLANSRAADLALAKAMHRLGSNGWEIVGRNFANFTFETTDGNAEFKNSIYFRRHQSQTQSTSQQ